MIDLSIIVVTYNSKNYIGGLLDSIKKSPDKLKKEIIVIDNASSDNSFEVAKNHSIKANVLKSGGNLGFSKAVNIGLKQASGEYIMLLNPDSKIIGNCLRFLYDFAKKTKPLGAVAPRLLESNGKPQPSVFHFPNITNAILKYFFNRKNYYGKYLPDQTQKVDVAVMAAFLMPASTIKKVGLLSEKFFMYYEDIEYCKRLKKNKLPVYYLINAKVAHVHGASGKFKSHTESPLLKSARTYHGKVYSDILNFILLIGQKWQKIIKRK
jgi:GT2 family glycosyltransferase